MKVSYEYRDTLMRLENVSLSYGDKVILKNVCAEVKDIFVPGRVTGQIVGFLGPSGIGKTSLFRVMAALLRPTSGQVLIADQEGLRPARVGDAGVVGQSYPLFNHRTVFGNLMLAAGAHEKDSKAAKALVEEGLQNFDLFGHEKNYPHELSGGQRQRVAILQMLLCREHVILLDEPFSGLDLMMIERTCETLTKAANLDERNTLVIISHDVTSLVAICDHIWLLGRDRDASGNVIPGARIVDTIDLLDKGLCYEPGLITSDSVFTSTVREIKERFRTL